MRLMLRWTLLSLPALLAASSPSAGQTDGQPVLRKVTVGDGVELHYPRSRVSFRPGPELPGGSALP